MLTVPTSVSTKSDPNFRVPDDSAALSKEERECVQAAMTVGYTEFVVPTPNNDTGATAWTVETWVWKKDGVPVAYLVARKTGARHFQVIGPEVELGTRTPKGKAPVTNGGLQKR